MKFIILKNNLKNGLNAIEKIGGESSYLPILKNCLIESFDNKIKLSATNLELAVVAFISGKVVENGGLTVPINIFSSIINNLKTERINLEAEKDKLIIKTDNYSAEIQGIKKEEFPIIPKIQNTNLYLKVKNSILKNALISIINSTGGGKPEFNGVLFDYQLSLLKLTTTDSFRLSEKTIFNTQFESNFNKNFKIIVPIKAIQELIKEFQTNEEGEVFIYLDSNQILFKTENIELITRLINGEFPNYQQIIPKNFETEILANKEQLINAIKLTGVFTDKLNEIVLNINHNSKNIEVFSSSGFGENKYLIPAKISGQPLEVKFNWKFFFDGVKNIDSENVFLGFNNSSKPIVIKSPEDASCFYILMPIKN